jgi:hypothetical protein
VSILTCCGCGGPRVPEGAYCAGCEKREREFYEARGTTQEEVQSWTDGDDYIEGYE